MTKGWWEAYSAFLEGEADMVLSYTTSPAYHVVAEEDDTKRAAAFAEGHYLQVELAAMLAGTDEPALARDFLAFLASPEAQGALPTTNWMFPAYPEGVELPEAFADLVEPERSLLYAPEDVGAAREQAIAQWLDAMSR